MTKRFLSEHSTRVPMTPQLTCAAFLIATLSGCAINQTVKPVERFEGSEVCLVEDVAVRSGFLQVYRRVLTEKGYEVRMLPPSSPLTACAITSTYTARWSWDLALYMAYADIMVFNNGRQSGQATYDATQGGGNMNKFIKGETKIVELVNQLFPGRAEENSSVGPMKPAP